MSTDVVAVILLGLGCAANPWGIMISVLLLNARRGHGIVWTYVVAWTGAIAVGLTVLVAGFGRFAESGSNSASTGSSIAELVLGLGLLAWGVQRIGEDRRAAAADASAAPKTPGWLQAVENIHYIPAFLLGIYSATWPLVIAAAGEIVAAGGSTDETVALVVLFVVLGSSTVAGVAALGTFAPSRSEAALTRLRAWLTVHSRMVITAILLFFGLSLTARGLTGLL